MPTSTPNFGLSQPLVNNSSDSDLWGGELNTNIGNDDTLLLAAMTYKTVPQTANFAVAGRTNGSTDIGNLRELFLCDATSGAIAATLPAASTVDNGFVVAFKKIDSSANSLTITPNGSDTIDGAATLVISIQYDAFVLVSDGTSNWSIMSYKHGVTPKNFSLNVQKITASGTYTPTAGIAYAIVEVTGGGGGGGGSGSGGGSAGGGGADGYAKVLLTAAQIGSSQSVTVGGSGAGGSAGNNPGSNGTGSSFGSLISTTGGAGAAAGEGGTAVEAGGAGGTATVSTGTTILNAAGQGGMYGGQAYLIISGAGGNTPIGMGGQSAQILNSGSTTINGANGTGYGSGGAGGLGGTTNSTGGNGAAGAVIVTEYIFA